MHRETTFSRSKTNAAVDLYISNTKANTAPHNKQGKNVQAQDGRSVNSTATLSGRKAGSQQRHLSRVVESVLALATPVYIGVVSLDHDLRFSETKQRPLLRCRVVSKSAFLSRRREVDKTENNKGHEREGLPEHPALCNTFSPVNGGIWKTVRQLEGSLAGHG